MGTQNLDYLQIKKWNGPTLDETRKSIQNTNWIDFEPQCKRLRGLHAPPYQEICSANSENKRVQKKVKKYGIKNRRQEKFDGNEYPQSNTQRHTVKRIYK